MQYLTLCSWRLSTTYHAIHNHRFWQVWVMTWQCISLHQSPWWRHQMETFSALLALCAGNSPVTGELPAQRPVTWSFDVFCDLRLNTRLGKQWWGWWFETPPRPLWRHCDATRYTDGLGADRYPMRNVIVKFPRLSKARNCCSGFTVTLRNWESVQSSSFQYVRW